MDIITNLAPDMGRKYIAYIDTLASVEKIVNTTVSEPDKITAATC